MPLGAGTDATRVASYNPWVSLYWLVTGRTIGGWTMYPERNRLDRTTALRLWTEANTWFSNEEGKKGMIKVGQLADLAVLSADYLTVAEEEIKDLTSVLTLLDGSVVHAGGPYRELVAAAARGKSRLVARQHPSVMTARPPGPGRPRNPRPPCHPDG